VRTVAWDTETHLIRPGCVAPRLVCMSVAEILGGPVTQNLLYDNLDRKAVHKFRNLINDPEVLLVGHNVVYDLGVLCAEDPDSIPYVFKALEEGRVRCTLVRQKLLDIAAGELDFRRSIHGGVPVKTKHTLAALSEHWINQKLAKEGTYRLRYGELDGVPLEKWPPEAEEYAKKDAETTLVVWNAQQESIARDFETADGKHDGVLPNEIEQNCAAWSLHLMSLWGVRTDPKATFELNEELSSQAGAMCAELQKAGLMREDGTKDLKAIRDRIALAYAKLKKEPPKTAKGAISTDEETLREAPDEVLKTLAKFGEISKLLSTYIPILQRGNVFPICARYNVLVASGRTSCSDPNLQNPPRKGKVREAFIPRPGNVFVAVDYDTLELRAWSQVNLDLFKFSMMAEALRAGQDLHPRVAATLLGCTYEEALARIEAGDKDALEKRQLAKPLNFGLPGGMGADKFVDFLATQKVKLHEDRDEAVKLVKRMITEWKKTWSESFKFFAYVSEINGTMRQLRSGRIRGGVTYCDAANSFFQGLAADGAKRALWLVAKACYVDQMSPLYGCRPVLFLHDEIIIEAPEARVHGAGYELARLMIEAMAFFIPDVPITAKPAAMRKWLKGCKPVHIDGVLVPSRPEKYKTDEGKEAERWIADVAA